MVAFDTSIDGYFDALADLFYSSFPMDAALYRIQMYKHFFLATGTNNIHSCFAAIIRRLKIRKYICRTLLPRFAATDRRLRIRKYIFRTILPRL